MFLPPEERDLEMKYLKAKVDAGVNFIFTQMFYDVEIFIEWVKAVRAAGITIPIVPGIAPIQTWNGFQRATSLAKIVIPRSFLDVLEPYQNNDEKVREIGTKLVADMCRRILKEDIGIRGLHFYTMNLEKGTKMLLQELNLVPRVETIKPLPWRQVRVLIPFSCDFSDIPRSVLPRPDAMRPFVRYSGPTGRSRTSRVQKTGMSIPTVGLVTHEVPRMVNSTVTACGSSRPWVYLFFTLQVLVSIHEICTEGGCPQVVGRTNLSR